MALGSFAFYNYFQLLFKHPIIVSLKNLHSESSRKTRKKGNSFKFSSLGFTSIPTPVLWRELTGQKIKEGFLFRRRKAGGIIKHHQTELTESVQKVFSECLLPIEPHPLLYHKIAKWKGQQANVFSLPCYVNVM